MRGTNESQKVLEDYGELIKLFSIEINKKRQEHQYTMFNIGNMDQTMCRFDMAMASTNDSILVLNRLGFLHLEGPKEALLLHFVLWPRVLKSLLTFA